MLFVVIAFLRSELPCSFSQFDPVLFCLQNHVYPVFPQEIRLSLHFSVQPLPTFSVASANCSDSFLSFAISSLESLLFAGIVILASFDVAKSFAVTFKIPFASISKVTSTWGIPLGGWRNS